MENEKILTISVAAYNAAEYIDNCLSSMLASDVADMLEIIVVNDGSKDNTKEIVHAYELKYPDIVRLINKPNGGHGSTINTTILAAMGKYYKIVDADDWVDRSGIERLVRWLKRHDVDLVLNPYHIVDASDRTRRKLVVPYNEGLITEEIHTINAIWEMALAHTYIVFKTDIVRRMGAVVDENCFYVDMEYTIFPMLYVKNFVCLDFPVYEYLLGTETQSMNINHMISRRDQHLRVVKRIVEFYCENKTILNNAICKTILYTMKGVVTTQYRIYAKMNATEAIAEVKEFDKWIKTHDEEIYEGLPRKFMSLIKFHRRTDFMFYKIIMNTLKFMNIEPK